jgi:5-methylcytosine-specific restriction endonuclease McrA
MTVDKSNIFSKKYLERKSKLKKDFPSAYAFLESIENREGEGFHIGTVKHLHLYYQDWLVFYLEISSNVSVRIGKRNGSIKKGTVPNYIRFFEILAKNFSQSQLKDCEHFEFDEGKKKYSLTINKTDKCALVFNLICKTLYEIQNEYDGQKTAVEEQQIFEEKCKKARGLSDKELQKKLTKAQANAKHRKSIVQQPIYERSEYVVAFALRRANGKCEKCGNPAPFMRDSDNTPFLEVHHKIPLAENGDDKVENVMALCPNCHRHAHYGKNTYYVKSNKNLH